MSGYVYKHINVLFKLHFKYSCLIHANILLYLYMCVSLQKKCFFATCLHMVFMLAFRWLNQKHLYICYIFVHVPCSLRQAFRELFVKDKQASYHRCLCSEII